MNEARYRRAEERLWSSLGVTPAESCVHLAHSDATIRVQEVGTGPVVVFVHGATNSGTSWAPLVARLEGFRCVVIDRPGCGLSEPLDGQFDDPARLGDLADSLVADALDSLGVERAHVAATSFGGFFAFRFAARHPARVDRLIEYGWTVGMPMERTPLIMRLGTVPGVSRLLGAMPPTKRLVRTIFRQIGLRRALETGRVTAEALDWYLALLRDTDTMRNELRAFAGLMTLTGGMTDAALFSPDLLAGISARVSLLWGEDDVVGGEAIARRLAGQLPTAELELIPGAGHAVWMDDPEYAASVTRSFLTA